MKQIQPYKNLGEAIVSLDNGGRFYNILTNAEDGKISAAELGKVGGLFNERQKMILFLELAISKLEAAAQADVLARLDDNLLASYHKHKAQKLLPSEAEAIGIISRNAIITGVPKMVGADKGFKGWIIIPVMTGKAMTFIPVPMIEKYNIYEVRDEVSSETFLIAHAREADILPERKIIVAGVFKELKSKKDEENSLRKFLEVNYYLELGDS